MTPGARVAAAADILDRVCAGAPAEQSLSNWARRSRFAGSGDRHAIRDLVFEALRCRRSFGSLGGGDTGRGLMIGSLRASGQDPAAVFTGAGYAPAPLTEAEVAGFGDLDAEPDAVRWNLPDWLVPELRHSLEDDLPKVARLMQSRALTGLRVNARKADHATADAALVADGIDSVRHTLSPWARVVTRNARRVVQSAAYREGLVELQDPGSQAIVASMLPVPAGSRILDYCAGGGGKALALAAATGVEIFAHDVDPERMKDIGPRAKRAGATVTCLDLAGIRARAPWDIVLVDAPCSGSGTWRRQPEAKWTLTPERLERLSSTQSEILDAASSIVAPGGRLVYATCSLLEVENRRQVDAFLDRTPQKWRRTAESLLVPQAENDGFYKSHLLRE